MWQPEFVEITPILQQFRSFHVIIVNHNAPLLMIYFNLDYSYLFPNKKLQNEVLHDHITKVYQNISNLPEYVPRGDPGDLNYGVKLPVVAIICII